MRRNGKQQATMPNQRRAKPKGTCVILLVQDLNVRVVNATTGELLRELTIDTTRDYQPRNTKIRTPSEGSDLSYLLRHHMVGLTGFEPATP
jgi:hypothetical protein